MSGEPPRRSTRGKRGTDEPPVEEAAAAAAPPPEKPKGKKGKSKPAPTAEEEAQKAAEAVEAELERARIAEEAKIAATPVPTPAASVAPPPIRIPGEDEAPPPPAQGPAPTPIAAALDAGVAASASALEKAASLSPGHPMEASQATASQGTVEGVEAEEANPMALMFYDVRPARAGADPTRLTPTEARKLNELLPSMGGERPIPWEAIEAYGATTPIFAFTLSLTPEPYRLSATPELTDEEFAKIATAGLCILYRVGGVQTLRILALGTRNDLRPVGEGFVEDPYLVFAVRGIAKRVIQVVKDPNVVMTYSRKQRPWRDAPASSAAAAASAARGVSAEQQDTEYMTTLGTLATLGFAYSPLNAAREYTRLRVEKEVPGARGKEATTRTETVLRWSVFVRPTATGLDKVVYRYAPPAKREAEIKVEETEECGFGEIVEVQRFSPTLADWEPSATVVVHALAGVVTGDESDLRAVVPAGANAAASASSSGDEVSGTISATVAANAPIDNARRGGKRRTYRKKAHRGKTAKRRA
jgi:hypothetical protein